MPQHARGDHCSHLPHAVTRRRSMGVRYATDCGNWLLLRLQRLAPSR